MGTEPARRRVVLATSNRGKVKELVAIFSAVSESIALDFLTLSDFADHPIVQQGVQEPADTLSENARIKALAYSNALGLPCIADDSGLEVDALDGRPGVHSARFSGENATDESNRAHLLSKVTIHSDPLSARFRCVLVLASNGEVIAEESGVVEGRIVRAARGSKGFGYDPLFVPDGYSQTMAELDAETKNSLSHRGRAASKLRAHLYSFANAAR